MADFGLVEKGVLCAIMTIIAGVDSGKIVRRENHKRAVAATRRCHRLLHEIVVAAMPVTHALPLVMEHRSRRISSKEDTGTNPFIILHITRRTKPIIQLCRFVSVFQ